MAKEQMIMSYFSSNEELEKAKQALENVGLQDIHIRRVTRFGITNDKTQDDPISRARTLTGIALYSTNTSNQENSSERVLLGADPSVSGFSTSDNPLPGLMYSLTVFVPEERVEEAVLIIKQNGGNT